MTESALLHYNSSIAGRAQASAGPVAWARRDGRPADLLPGWCLRRRREHESGTSRALQQERAGSRWTQPTVDVTVSNTWLWARRMAKG